MNEEELKSVDFTEQNFWRTMMNALASRVDLELITIYLKEKRRTIVLSHREMLERKTNLKVLNHMESG